MRKTTKGIYYTNGNYEAFARPEKPEGVDDKHAYLVGSGLALWQQLASLYVTTDAWRSHPHSGGDGHCRRCSCDGIFDPMQRIRYARRP
ncbi:MAG: hypothetical protein ACLTER_23860 [Ruminococcus sp.]